MILKQELMQQVSCCLATLYISIHVVLGTASMWLKGLQLVAQVLESVVTKKSSSIHTASQYAQTICSLVNYIMQMWRL